MHKPGDHGSPDGDVDDRAAVHLVVAPPGRLVGETERGHEGRRSSTTASPLR